MKRSIIPIVAVAVGIALTGCSNKKLMKEQEGQIANLQAEVDELSQQLDAERARSDQLNNELSQALSEHRMKQQVWMEEKESLTRVTLDGEVTYNSGSAQISDEGRRMLDRIWEVLANYPDRDVLIEGHTDDVPIAERWQHRFLSNWELSSARAHAVLHYVVKKFGVDPSRVAAVGYGEYRPIASNATEDGRAANRRVVITVGPGTRPRVAP